MTLDEIKQLIEFIRSQELSEFEWEQDGARIRIKIGQGHHVVTVPHAPASDADVRAAAAAAARRRRAGVFDGSGGGR